MDDDYYRLPCGYGGFQGDVIKLSAKEYDYLFQNLSTVTDYDFREKLHRFDEWLRDKPHKVYSNWIKHIVNWLQNEGKQFNEGNNGGGGSLRGNTIPQQRWQAKRF